MLGNRATFTFTVPSGLSALAAMQEKTVALQAAASSLLHDALTAIALVKLDYPEMSEPEDDPEL